MRAVVAAVLIFASGCRDQPPARPSSQVDLHDCRVVGHAGAARCAEIRVPEDRARPDGKQISLHVAIVPAAQSALRDPVVLLAGGPGQAATEAFGPMLAVVAGTFPKREIVLVDQRGTGSSNALRCPDPPQGDLDAALSAAVDTDELDACLAGLAGDPRHYTSDAAADDLEAVRKALGYASLNLIGVSYGTRLALVYARRHPDGVRTLTLDGVVPTSAKLPLHFAAATDASLDRVFGDCQGDAACTEAFGQLRTSLDRIDEHLGAGKDVELEHPRTGEAATVHVTSHLVRMAVRAMLYDSNLSSLLPLALTRAADGDLKMLIGQAVAFGDAVGDGVAGGLFLSVVCAEDVPFLSADLVAEHTAGTRLGDALVVQLQEMCARWGSEPVDARFLEPVRTAAPILLLSGELDPATPPSMAETVAKDAESARAVVVPGVAHGTLIQPCVLGLVGEFIDSADATGLDVSCVDAGERPRFFIDLAGPPT